MQASQKKTAPSMEQCFYGKGCTRKDCFYRHDGPGAGGGEGNKSGEPCMPFLAGLCTFTAGGCKKRHPSKAEAERLVNKYSQMKCRYGAHCKTAGCLYIHPGDDVGDDTKDRIGGTSAFPPLAGCNGLLPRAMPPAGAWKPMQPTGATTMISPSLPLKSAWKPSPPPAVTPAWGGHSKNPVLAYHANANGKSICSVATSTILNGGPSMPLSASSTPYKPAEPATPAASHSLAHENSHGNSVPHSPRNSDSPALNIHAREFVPGGF
jgi:hypothetical protein